MLLKEGDMLGLILCAVSVLQERIRRERQSLIKGNTAGTGPPSEYVTSVLAFFIKHTMQRPVPEVVWSFVQFIPDTSWPGFAYFLNIQRRLNNNMQVFYIVNQSLRLRS